MKTTKALASALVLVLMLTSMTMSTVGVNTNRVKTHHSNHVEDVPLVGAQRVVLMEEFTHWNCGQCTVLKNYLEPAVENYTFAQVAPLYYHTSIAGNDPVFIYNGLENFQRESYYGASTNPWTEVDGIYERSFSPIPNGTEINGWFDKRLAIPANITIATTGSLDVVNLTGSVRTRIEAVEPIAATDLVVQFALWEDHIDVIDRFGTTGSNGETEFRWTMWDMVPDALGEAIWPGGADRWDSIDLFRNFTIEPAWNASELGMTIWVQNVGTRLVEQANVEDFGNFGDHAPFVDVLTPGVEDLIMPGSYDITWAASDYEDTDLDITVEYSPDGGSTWFILESGIDNNDGTYTWDTTGLADGPNYIVRVSATDSAMQTSVRTMRQPFSIDNTANDEWFLQVQASGPNLDLDMKPMEKVLNSIDTIMSTAGDYLIGTWETTSTFTDATINGNWTFNVYGRAKNNALTGFLHANVLTSTGPTLLDSTGNDNENVGAFTAGHLFSWNETLAGAVNDGDRLIVELWLDVTNTQLTFEQTLNPDVDADASGWTGYDWGPMTNLVNQAWQPSGGNPSGWLSVAFISDKFNPSLGGYWEQAFTPSGAPSAAALSFQWRCSQYVSVSNMDFYVFIDSVSGPPTMGTEVWTQSVAGTTSWASVGPIDVLAIVSSSSTYYLKIAVWVDGAGSATDSIGGFDNAIVTWETPFTGFITEFDFGDAQSNVVPSLEASFAIGPLNVGWNFVSTPLIPGDQTVPAVLSDLDGDTAWTMLRHYDAADAPDPWKAWSSFGPPALNDLGSADHTVGLWLYIPDAPSLGDGMIRMSGAAPSSTMINLKAGWNMVGYPATDDSAYYVDDLIAATGATDVEGFNPAAPYHIEALPGGYVLKRGEAYWIRVNSDTTWTVNW
jgi:hypothetical protein